MINYRPIILSTITLISDIERKYREMLHGDDEDQRERDENSLHEEESSPLELTEEVVEEKK